MTPAPYYQSADGRAVLYHGDALEVLRGMPGASTQCVVTSPPYWGLRNYGVDGQIGLEPTPEAFVARMVEVFREVHRVLRDDGTCWINLGSSYASGSATSRETPSHHDANVLGCDRTNKGRSGLLSVDRAYRRSDGVQRGGTPNHHAHSSNTGQPSEPVRPRSAQTGRDSGHEDSSSAVACSWLGADPASTTPSCTDCAPAASSHEGAASVCPRELQTSSGDVPPCAGTAACISCTAGLQPTSGHRRSDKAPFSSACGDPSCNGNCGICWAHCTMPALQFKAKDLISMPHLLAFALQADGWYLRSDIIWAKGVSFCPTYSGSCMPESTRDRPTTAHEHVFLLTKQPRYFYDQEAVRERGSGVSGGACFGKQSEGAAAAKAQSRQYDRPDYSTRNIRNVWAISPQPSKLQHFAAFPEKLVEPCIQAGTSERGCCPACGTPWERIIDATRYEPSSAGNGERQVDASRGDKNRKLSGAEYNRQVQRRTLGFRPACACDAGEPVPCTVLDLFAGTATAGVVAIRLGRRFVGIELNPEYADMAKQRLAEADARHTLNLTPAEVAAGQLSCLKPEPTEDES